MLRWFEFINFESRVEAGRLELNELIRHQVSEQGPEKTFIVELADTLDPSSTGDGSGASTAAAGCRDGIHFSDAGYRCFGRLIAEALVRRDGAAFVPVGS